MLKDLSLILGCKMKDKLDILAINLVSNNHGLRADKNSRCLGLPP